MNTPTPNNPLLSDWSKSEYGLPPFSQIQPQLFEPALMACIESHELELKSIAETADHPTFENTIEAFESAGSMLDRVSYTFENLCSSCSPPELQAVEMKMAGPMALHSNRIYTYPGLYTRISSVYERKDNLNLNAEQKRLVEKIHLDFVKAGAKFDKATQTRYKEIVEELAELTTKFTQNVMADETEVFLALGKEDIAGLPEDLLQAARQAALDRSSILTKRKVEDMGGGDSCSPPKSDAKTGGFEDPVYIVTLSRSLVVPFLTFSDRRDLREKAFNLWTRRGELDDKRANIPIAKRILELRAEQAALHNYTSFAHFNTANTMAGGPEKVMELLNRVWGPAKASVDRERAMLEDFIRTTGGGEIDIQPWDWRFYAEKVRQSKYDLDEAEVKPYFSLDNMVIAMFDVSEKLFGLTFKYRPDITVYHPDAKVYEVFDTAKSQDQPIAIFIHDNYSRPHKQSGAWMSNFREQSKGVIPIVINNNNFNKGSAEEPTLLSFDDCVTLFHEFGHGLHGMLSDATYSTLAGTSVLRDFVELPSQLYEHWVSEPEVLKKHAHHFKTGEPIPDALLGKMMDARLFNIGFATVEYTVCALLDTALHQQKVTPDFDLAQFEREELQRLGMPQGIVMRHRPAHFTHLFSGDGYAAAYYVYLWAEVLDADAFDAFKEAGDVFDQATAQRLRQCIYSSGNTLPPQDAFRSFRGRDPQIEPMLKKKGLLVVQEH